ncbi:MAG: zinc transport system substrate-binding protein [Thermoplasmata archaeon]|jgi:zinc transport system substrate-binding protein|nr:zinc transport system substrate-binding protein [Thermoplasmata archaeon]
MRVALLTGLLVLAPVLAGCANGPHPDVMATFYPLVFFSEEIGGDGLSVGSVVKPGTEPHDYEPTTKDLDKIVHAKALVIQGAGFEGWLETAQDQAPDTRLIVASNGIGLHENPDEDEAEELPQDPHTWLDPVLAQDMAHNIEAGLSASFPDRSFAIHANTVELVGRLQALDADFAEGLAHCQLHVIITTHSAFAYMAERYGFEQVGLSGLDPNEEPSPAAIQDAIDLAREHNVTVIFFEELVSPRVAETVAREVGAETRVLSPIESAQDGKDYFGIMHDNLDALRAAMNCT